MTFTILPTIDIMSALYRKPRNIERFKKYIQILEGGTKGDLAMPIGGFNPMGKDHVLHRLTELKELDAEGIINHKLNGLNKEFSEQFGDAVFKVALSLSDDLMGGWTNRYTSDYDGKFKLNAMVSRGFCIITFWTGELFDTQLIKERTIEACYRTMHWLEKPKPKTLEEHIAQEKFAASKIKYHNEDLPENFEALDGYYKQNKDTEDYHVIFNFLYGDNASIELGFPAFGITDDMAGFKYARAVTA